MRGKKALVLFLLVPMLLLAACSSGISQEKYDAVILERDALQSELEALKAKCPPGNFSSLTALESWLHSNPVSDESTTTYADAWFRKALRLQQDAIEDGYLISADWDYDWETDLYLVWCNAVAGSRLFYWNPETDDVYEEFAFGTVQ